MTAAGLIMDVVLMGLLLAALWFGVRLNGRLKSLRNGQESFIKAVGELDQAAIKAHASLRELHHNAEESQELLHGRIMAARDLLNKLESQINRAERAQRDLESGIATARVEPVRVEPEPVEEPPLRIQRETQQREEWSRARGAEARQTYAGNRRPAFDDEIEDDELPLPDSRRLRDLNDRLSRREPAPTKAETEQVSEFGLQAINEMLRAFADPKGTGASRSRDPLPERRPDTVPRPASPRSRQPSVLDDELFGGQGAEDADPTPPRPLFRRTR
ncbi:DUF6468 domain-containing protein [Asticcacaulis sp. YBE204]|uniref:DUF6468 domain-containing protein n=1 Tax=Asticcacaulis sp. YBE204 TaxID=1282363 RepID=UPI0003C3F08C|nr:DUF6468 domain-containing protein [Asticcacaulis sp. YBE204]ESQ80086.1 hypothetical protein AEYBE204_05565 [Asticcacaulis sp. YBE204]